MTNLFELQKKIAAVREQIMTESRDLTDSKKVYEMRKAFLDKTGKVGQLMRYMKDVDPSQRAEFGKTVNELKNWAQDYFGSLDEKMRKAELQRVYKGEQIDITMPAHKHVQGNLHPVTQVRNQLIDVFSGMGFEIYEGTEVENDYYNFTALNTPKDHPARDMQDTFYLSPEFVLRTQTSSD